MIAWALVNDIKRHNSGRRFPPRADVDVDLCGLLFRDDLHVIPVIPGLVRENCLGGHAFTQTFSYPFHLQSPGGSFRSDHEGRFGGIDGGRRNWSPAWYGEGVGTR